MVALVWILVALLPSGMVALVWILVALLPSGMAALVWILVALWPSGLVVLDWTLSLSVHTPPTCTPGSWNHCLSPLLRPPLAGGERNTTGRGSLN